MCFCYFDPFGPHRAPMQNPSVFHGLATWSDQKMVTGSAHQALDVVFRKLNLMGRESEGGVGSRFCLTGGRRISKLS